ncbi:3-hydroxyacyl-CoA dehydrogenase family protein [Intestinibacillus massiliensis]|uniref:3-hydroxyacyl-CoA dehydrogenase family protein n=1 Tax=Intestinibacillus massiliensis TaxID=1871029 RepID=UPI000B34CBB1|nr:3-hydroxyacyl-CoA dehydrogenase family protein [Intestinibacillus massiliensis]MCB6365049.1 3-hydroxyacyl-CoA dehydrogenase family protein [Intestinibacillus massiliensis]
MNINTVTVLGANGTMGCNISGIFASFGNAKVYMVSRSMEKAEAAVAKAAQSVKAEAVESNLIPCDYSMLEKCVGESDLIFESVAETFDAKESIIAKIAPFIKKKTLIATGTSGLSITRLAEMLPEELRPYFFGMHFFNPPYSLTLCEIIPSLYTEHKVIEYIKCYAAQTLVRTVVEIRDDAAFLGNRIGFQFINEALQYAERYKDSGGIDYIDAILGQFTGRNMAPINTADFVGLDVSKAVVDNIYQNTDDYAHETFIFPEYCCRLVREGKLGRKTGQGLYKSIKREDGRRITYVYDIESGEYRDKMTYSFPFSIKMIEHLKNGEYKRAMDVLTSNHSTEAQICLSFLIKYVLYSITAAKLVSDSAHAADHVMAAGFGWAPPLSIIDALGGKYVFMKLAKERLDPALIAKINVEETMAGIPAASTYDFRRYFKGKK